MLKLGLVFIFLVYQPFQSESKAQDSILLLNGEVIKGRISQDLGDFFRFEREKGEEVTSIAVEKTDIFSVYYQGREEVIIYQQDSALGNDFSTVQMRDFMAGEKQAMKDYRPKLPVYGGVIAGAAGAYAGFWGIALAPVYLGALSLRKPIPAKGTQVPEQVLDPELYRMGYSYTARRMKIQRSAMTCLGGLVTVWIIRVATGGLK